MNAVLESTRPTPARGSLFRRILVGIDGSPEVGTRTYRAAVVHDFTKPLVLEPVAKLDLEPDQIRVKVEASGLCHTDIHAAHGDWPIKPSPPFIPGHEGVGIVEELGAAVTDVALGDRVAMPWLGYACGTCDSCVSGWETLCLEPTSSPSSGSAGSVTLQSSTPRSQAAG